MYRVLNDKRIILGITGSIAAYKSVILARLLKKERANIDVVMSDGATKFVTPLTLKAITHELVMSNIYDLQSYLKINHVSVAERADLIVIAPATANTIAKLANGFSDNPVTATVLASRSPIVICPAMDGYMYKNPITMENISKLEDRGFYVLGPETGDLASGLSGEGRMVEPGKILEYIKTTLGHISGDFKEFKIVVSAGGTREKLDPVRHLTNRSSGKMGYALAETARDRGAEVVLVSASKIESPIGVNFIAVESAKDMEEVLVEQCSDADILIMAAAVSDWTPVNVNAQKMKKDFDDSLEIKLVKTTDILERLKTNNKLVKIGFAAETENLVPNARKKMIEKKLDVIAANDVSYPDSGFESENNKIILVDKHGGEEDLGMLTKQEASTKILDKIKTIIKIETKRNG
tara:strand:+ start:1092 stop:2315 length:1224 start_codon:yes stop_codon:yes gene_type:complete